MRNHSPTIKALTQRAMKDLHTTLQSFYGYLELGMDVEAKQVLEDLPSDEKSHPAVFLCQLELLMLNEKWDEAIVLGQSLCGDWPQESEFWFRIAYCFHQSNQTTEAKRLLLEAPSAIKMLGLYDYNLACYEAEMGNLENARDCLKISFEKDSKLRQQALEDPKLEQVWKSMS